MDEVYSKIDQGYILLAYYFGRLKVLNNIALLRITDELVHAFEQVPENRSTKYSVHIEGCCLCQEREDIFKILLKQHYETADPSRRALGENSAGGQDLDEAWRELTTLWKDAGLLVEGEDSAIGVPILNFAHAAQSLLLKHGVKLYDKEKYNDEGRNKNWRALMKAVKNKLEECLFTIGRINRKDCLSVPGPTHTKRSLRNIYLGLLVMKGARMHAKFLQNRRTVGIQIRAAKEPIAVVAKYMLCAKCFDPQNRVGLIIVTDILKRCLEDLETHPMLDEPPNVGERLGSLLGQRRVLADQSIEQNNFSSPCSTQQPNFSPDTLRRSIRRAHAVKKRHEEFVYYANGLGPHSEEDSTSKKSKSGKRRRATLPDVSPLVSKSIPIRMKQERISPTKDNFNVIIFTSGIDKTTPATIAQTDTASSSVPTASTQPSGFTLLPTYGHKQTEQVVHTMLNAPPVMPAESSSSNTTERPKVIPISPRSLTKILTDSKSRRVFFVPSAAGNKGIDLKTTTVLPMKAPAVATPVVRGRSFSLDSVPRQKVMFQTIKPKTSSAEETSPSTAERNLAPKKPFLVQIVDGKISKAASSRTVAKAVKKRTQNVFRTIPMNGSQLKFVDRPVPLKNQTGFIRTFQGFRKMIAVREIKAPATRVVPKTLVMGNSDNRPIMRIGPLTINTPQTRKHVDYGRSFTFKTNNPNLFSTNSSTKTATYDNPKLQSALHTRPRTIPANLNAPSKSYPQAPAACHAASHKKAAPTHMCSPSKTPAKKRNLKLPSKSMATVVAEYIFSLMPTADEALWKKVQDRNKRRGEKSGALIPIPYETNFLCISDTIERQGWKAYWYRKCRCSKIREREAEADAEGGGDAEQTPTEIAEWVPKCVTDSMRETLTLSMEMDDRALSKEKFTPVKILLDGDGSDFQLKLKHDEKLAPESAPLDMPKVNSFLQGSSEKVPSSENLPQTSGVAGSRKRKFDEAACAGKKHTPTLTLKAKYRKDKDGNWTAMKTDDSESASKHAQGIEMTRRISNPFETASYSEDSVMLNIRPGFDVPRSSCVSMEDRVGTTHDHGLRRCARATMIRRKALVQRAVDAELKSKGKREKAELNATRCFLFNSFRDESFAWPVFDVLSAHPMCFRQEPDQFVRISEMQEKRGKILRAVCRDDGAKTPKEKCVGKSYDNSFLSLLSNTSTNFTAKESATSQLLKRKSSKGFLARKLDRALEESVSEPANSSVVTQKSISFVGGNKAETYSIWRRKVVSQIKPKDVFSDLQVLRGVSATAPPTNVISREAARFVVDAIQTPNDELGIKLEKRRPSAKPVGVEPSRTPTKTRIAAPLADPPGTSDYLPAWLRDTASVTTTRAKRGDQATGAISKDEDFTQNSPTKPDLSKNYQTPSTEGATTDSFSDRFGDRDMDIDVVTVSPARKTLPPDEIIPVSLKDSFSARNFEFCSVGPDSLSPSAVGVMKNCVPIQVPSFSAIYQDVKMLSKTSTVGYSLQPEMDFDLGKRFSRFLFLNRMRCDRKLSSTLGPKYSLKKIKVLIKKLSTTRRGTNRGASHSESEHEGQTSGEVNGISYDPWWEREKFDNSPDAFAQSESWRSFENDFMEMSPCFPSPEVIRGLKFSRCSKPDAELNAESEFAGGSPPQRSDDATPTSEHSDVRLLEMPGSSARDSGSDSVPASPLSGAKSASRRKRVPHNALDGMYWSNVVDADGREPKNVGIYLRRRHVNGGDATDIEQGRAQVNKRKRPGCGYSPCPSGDTAAILQADDMSLKKFNEDLPLDVESEDIGLPFSLEPLHALLSTTLDVERVFSWMWDSATPRPLKLITTSQRKLPAERQEVGRLKRWHSVADAKTERPASDCRKGYASKDDLKAEKTSEKRYFSDGDQRPSEPSFPIESPSRFQPLISSAYVPLIRCPTPSHIKSSTASNDVFASLVVESPATRLYLIKFADENGQRCDKRPRGLSNVRGGQLGRQFDIPGLLKTTSTRFEFDEFCGGEIAYSAAEEDATPVIDIRPDRCDSPEQGDSEGESSLATPKRTCRLRRAGKRKICGDTQWTEIQGGRVGKRAGRGRCGAKLLHERKKTKLQALRESVFAELKRKRRYDKKPAPAMRMSWRQSSATDRRRPLLQSTCSTQGSFISRLLESDAAGSLSSDAFQA